MLSNYKSGICTFLALFSIISPIFATISQNRKQIESNHQTIVVDPSKQGAFKSIQSAIDSVPSNNQKWTTIDIKQGVYKERVKIPRDKQFIYLKGAGKENTLIVYNAEGGIDSSATFTSEADNTLAKDITFTNSYNSPSNRNGNPIARALAARIQGDKSGFYRCGFFSVQDTLWDDHGRHFFKSCTIQGAVDFIFGAGQSQYQSCTISIAAPNGGYITAQARGVPEDSSGFVFNSCNIVGRGRVYLGRPWRDYARVLFYNTSMSNVVSPQGWFASTVSGKEELSEYGCSGPGAKRSKRVRWEKKLSEREVNQLTSISFIDNNQSWVNQASQILGV
ncbi:Pectin lyase-like superfamily protein [Perilla frutescens var. hirtella]|nr:Pectin lyase-like superfamily protein [Perilla frutescens var. hirtella]